MPENIQKLLTEAISINSAYNSEIIEPTKPGEKVQQLGNKTECGLLGFVNQIGGNYKIVRLKNPEESFLKVLSSLFFIKKIFKVYTFNSSRKSMITVIALIDEETNQKIGYRVFCKGAAEILLSK